MSLKQVSKSPVAFVLKGYPRLSETFIAQEIRALEQRGLDIRIISLRHPTDKHRHPIHGEITAPVNYLPEYLHQEPFRVLRAWWAMRRKSRYRAVRRIWLADLKRDRSRNRIRRFGQALVLAHELPGDIQQIHAHFLHTPASVARYSAILRDLPWSVSAHAKDIWTSPDWEIAEKLADCQWLTVCSGHARDHLLAIVKGSEQKVQLNYHGIDLDRFPTPVKAAAPGQVLQLLAVGRAVSKKGFRDLLLALSYLDDAIHWHLTHIGGGPLLAELNMQAKILGINRQISWQGARPQEDVLAAYRQADLFVLPAQQDETGDQDGLPNVLMEAQSQGLACISTTISAVPELINDSETGLLVPPNDPAALAAAISRFAHDRAFRDKIAKAGERRVRENFDFRQMITPLARNFGLETE